MSKLTRRTELVANVLIICVAVLLGTVIVQKYFFASADHPKPLQPKIGFKMSLPDVEWSGRPKTLVLALQTDCHFCNESAPFYKRLIQETQGGGGNNGGGGGVNNVKLIAVFPKGAAEGKAHLSEIGLAGLEVRESPLESMQVSGTPTLVLTNEKGEVTNAWVGKLSPAGETEVLEKLKS